MLYELDHFSHYFQDMHYVRVKRNIVSLFKRYVLAIVSLFYLALVLLKLSAVREYYDLDMK